MTGNGKPVTEKTADMETTTDAEGVPGAESIRTQTAPGALIRRISP